MKLSRILGLAMSLALLGGAAGAQDYPSRPIRLVVPFAPGGATDITARIMAEAMSAQLGQQIFVENKPGANNQIGVQYALGFPADGYTVLMGTISTAMLGITNKSFTLDLTRELTGISGVVQGATLIAVNGSFPAKTLAEFLAYAKANPGKLNYGSQGASDVLGSEALSALAGIKTETVRYTGGSLVLQALLANEIHYSVFFPGIIKSHMQTGQLRAIAVTGKSRLPEFPDLPAVAEQVPGFEFISWSGLLAKAGTPKPIVDRLHAAAHAALDTPTVRAKLGDLSYQIVDSSPEQFSRFWADEVVKWTAVAERAGFKAE